MQNICPECKAVLNAARTVQAAPVAPVAGQITICAYCATPMFFTDTLSVRRMREDEFEVLPTQLKSDMTQVRLRILSAKAKRDAQH